MHCWRTAGEICAVNVAGLKGNVAAPEGGMLTPKLGSNDLPQQSLRQK